MAKKRIPYTNILETQALKDIAEERARQQRPEMPKRDQWSSYGESYTPRWDDDTNDDGELARAAAVYAYGATYPEAARKSMLQQAFAGRPTRVFEMWPASWDFASYKPTTLRRDLVKAGALILAEIERLDRKAVRDERDVAESYDTEQRMINEYGDAK